ncbi:hypothetical protein BV20DRAFT_122776 [Pilatotrama ljubarskyi]|nr:hypothetical protein BV20DRAFT_122776 [Pilatotrama ljubarskyi]
MISGLSSLRYVHLKNYPMRYVSEQEDAHEECFLEALRELFEREEPPFTALEHLELWMQDIEGVMVFVRIGSRLRPLCASRALSCRQTTLPPPRSSDFNGGAGCNAGSWLPLRTPREQ